MAQENNNVVLTPEQEKNFAEALSKRPQYAGYSYEQLVEVAYEMLRSTYMDLKRISLLRRFSVKRSF